MLHHYFKLIYNPLNLEINPFTLHFYSRDLENEFTNEYKRKNLAFIILFTLSATLLFFLFFLLRTNVHSEWYYIMGISSILFGILLRSGKMFKYHYLFLFLFSMFFELSYNHRMLYYAYDNYELATYFIGLIQIIVILNLFLRLKFVAAILLNFIFFVVYVTYSIWKIHLVNVNSDYFYYTAAMLLSTAAVVCISIYRSEYINRSEFIQQKIIRQQTKELSEAKDYVEQKVIERTRELEQERNKKMKAAIRAQQVERERIAKDLHDTLNIKLIALKRKLELYPDNSEVLIDIDSVIEQVREISHNLLPYSLKHYGLIKAVEYLCLKIGNDSGLDVKISKTGINDDTRWDSVIENELFKIIQEIMANCMKHANASILLIDLIGDGNMLFISIEDNGVGFIPQDKRICCSGLYNMEERVNFLGGTLSIDSQLGKGTTVMINIPMT